MDLSIVILNYKTPRMLRRCLRGVYASPPSCEFEVLVVDNGSEDGTPGMVRSEFPQAKMIEAGKNLGFAGGNNLGMREAKGRYVLVLNPDIIVFQGALDKMLAAMEADPEIGILAPQLLNPDGSVQDSCYRFPKFSIPLYRRTPLGKLPHAKRKLDHYLMKEWDHASEREVDWVLGGCMMARADDVKEVGLLDERFFMYLDDTDWCRRFWKNGSKVVYDPSIKFVHYHRRESAEKSWLLGILSKTARVHMASWMKYFAKYKGENHEHTRQKA